MASDKDSTPPVFHAEYMGQHRSSSEAEMQAPHAEHGPTIDHKISNENVIQARPDITWSRVRAKLREPLAEFFGVFILIMFGDGVVAQVVLSKGTKGNFQSINWGWVCKIITSVWEKF